MAMGDLDNLPLVQRYRQLIAGVHSTRHPQLPQRTVQNELTICRRSIAAVLSEQEQRTVPSSSATPSQASSRLHSTVDGRDQLLELHEQATNGLGTLPEEDAATRNARYKTFFDRLDRGRLTMVAWFCVCIG
jgi:hypothetical protein